MNKVDFLPAKEMAKNVSFSVLLATFFCVPLLRSVSFPSVINFYADWTGLVVAVYLTLFYLGKGEPRSLLASREGRFLLGGFGLFSIFWLCGGIWVFFIDRYILFFSLVILALVLSDIYGRDEHLFMRLLRLKIAVIAGVVLFCVLFIYAFQDPDLKLGIKNALPIYYNIRQLNYDLFFTIPVLLLLLHRSVNSIPLLGFLFAFLFMAVWSGGRGMLVALAISWACVRLRYWRAMPTRLELVGLLLLSAAVACVVITDKAVFLQHMVMRTVDAESINGLSSNRVEIWRTSLAFFSQQDIYNQLFGLGPQAFLRHGIFGGGIAQPHNSLVQVLLEFGLVGLVGFVMLLVNSCWKSLQLVLTSRSDIDVLAGSVLIGGVAFSLVDGIFYHTAPLTMMLVLITFVQVRYRGFVGDKCLSTHVSGA